MGGLLELAHIVSGDIEERETADARRREGRFIMDDLRSHLRASAFICGSFLLRHCGRTARHGTEDRRRRVDQYGSGVPVCADAGVGGDGDGVGPDDDPGGEGGEPGGGGGADRGGGGGGGHWRSGG